MLDQLVESRNQKGEDKKKNILLLGTLAIVFGVFVSAMGYSLFAHNPFVGGDGLELSTLVAPPIPEEEPPPPEEKEPEKEKPQKQINADVRKVLIANILSTPKVPKDISTKKMKNKAMNLNTPTQLGDRDVNAFNKDSKRPTNAQLEKGGGFPSGKNQPGADNGKGTGPKAPTPTPPPPLPPPPQKPKPKVPKRISKGVVNGKATSLPKPAYPATAKSANIRGSVNVAIVISKAGRVMSARAVSGHPLLRRAAVSAARRARFAPTKLSGQAVEVSGVIVYNFQ